MREYAFIPNGGLNQSGSLTDAQPHECVDGANIVVTPGGFRPRPGRVLASRVPVCTPTAMSGGALTLWEYLNPAYAGVSEAAAVLYVGQFNDPAVADAANTGGGLWYTTLASMDFADVGTPAYQVTLPASYTIPYNVKARAAQVGDSLYLCSRVSTQRVLRLFGMSTTHKYEAVALTDEQVPTTPPAATSVGAAGPAYIVADTYRFKASYGISASGETSEGAAGPELVISVASGVSSLVRRVTLDPGIVAGDSVYLYAIGGDSAIWLRVGARQLSAGDIAAGYYDFTLNGATSGTIYNLGTTPLPEYLNRPPVGCDGVVAYRNRALYWKGRRLYISNDGDPGRVPQVAFDTTDETYGGWVDVGDGESITGIGVQDGYALVFTAHGVWQLSGEPGLPYFGLREISRSVGCVSHESIANCENICVWVGESGVWAFDGQRLSELGAPINPTLRSSIGQALASSFAVYDPQQRLYRLHVRAVSGGTWPTSDENNHRAYLYDFTLGLWYPPYSLQPACCLLYAGGASTPAIYASNAAGGTADGSGAIYRLDAGGQDATRSGNNNIAWNRVSPEQASPAGLFQQVREVIVWGHDRQESTANAQTLTLTVYQNEETTPDTGFTPTATWTPQQSTGGVARATYPPHRATSHRVGISGTHTASSSASTCEIRRVAVQWTPRGRVPR